MTLLGARLIGPKIAAFALAFYAGCYGLFLLFIVVAALFSWAAFLMLTGLLALAATPFIAVLHLFRATTPDVNPPAYPKTMAVVMCVPTLFWVYLYYDTVGFDRLFDLKGQFRALIFVLTPGLLSLWLVVTFVLLALRDRSGGDPKTNTTIQV